MMKNILKKFEKTIVFLLKMSLYICIFVSFFLMMGITNRQLLRLSRTAGVTMVTFIVLGLVMIAAYGGYDIGKRKSKPIISSLSLATVITDIVTYIQLSIMNTNIATGLEFRFENISILILVIIIQVLIIIGFAYGGNAVFFTINDPESCCIITSSKESFVEIAHAVGAFKKQYCINMIVDYRSVKLKDCILACDTVFIYNVPIRERTEIAEFCYRNMRHIYFNPEISDIAEISSKHVILDDISLINAPVKEMSFEQKTFKRVMDIVFSMSALIITSPIFVFCMISIKLGDGGKVIFKQQRATKDGKIFYVYKFRTMKENIENYSATEEDDRITKVGKTLRKYRLDELPQFFNILKGDMSLVGPRPEMLENIYMYTKEFPEFAYRLRVKAGLTGYAQIAGKYNTSPKYKLILDLLYIENYSLVKDLKLILQTLIVLFKPDSTAGFSDNKQKEYKKYEEIFDKCWMD